MLFKAKEGASGVKIPCMTPLFLPHFAADISNFHIFLSHDMPKILDMLLKGTVVDSPELHGSRFSSIRNTLFEDS